MPEYTFQLEKMEKEIIAKVQKELGSNLVSLIVEGSFATYDYIAGYSDYDLLVLVKNNKKAKEVSFDALSKKYKIEIQCVIKSYNDLINRIKNNNEATRFISNLSLIKYTKQIRVLSGKDIEKIIPPVKDLVKRDLGCELRSGYLYATNPNKAWDIFRRQPRKWINYIINMSNDLLLSKGIIVQKVKIPHMLKKYFPEFKGQKYVREALKLRASKKILNLAGSERKKIKQHLFRFLNDYKDLVFY